MKIIEKFLQQQVLGYNKDFSKTILEALVLFEDGSVGKRYTNGDDFYNLETQPYIHHKVKGLMYTQPLKMEDVEKLTELGVIVS